MEQVQLLFLIRGIILVRVLGHMGQSMYARKIILSLILVLFEVVICNAAFFKASTFLPSCFFDVTTLAAGFSANTIAPICLSNAPGGATSNTTWTTSSTKYVSASDNTKYIIKTLSSYRDVEISTWVRDGYVYLRLDTDGNAIYFYHNGGTSNGTLEIGIVTGLNQNSYPSGTYYLLYSNADLVGTVGTAGSVCTCGYTKTATDGQYFTFGASGFDIYVKYGSVQFATFKEYRQMSAGAVALKANSGIGFRNGPNSAITITQLQTQFLYSNYAAGQIDMRDWGLRSISTTGSISASSNSLVIAISSGFQVGDWVIVDLGAESGAGLRGTIGVGGQWPALTYATAAALQADHTKPQFTFAWAQNTGEVWRYVSGSWVQSMTAPPPAGEVIWCGQIGGDCTSSYYYPSKAVPRALHARISAISGNGLTLTLVDKNGAAVNAAASATGANVYLDNQSFFNDLLQTPRGTSSAITPANLTLITPAGSYALGGHMFSQNHTAWTIQGAGQALTTFFSGKGLASAGIFAQALPTIVVKDFKLIGNYGNNYFGLDFYDTLIPVPTSTQTSQYDAAGRIIWTQTEGSVNETSFKAAWFPSGINLTQCDNGVVQDVTVNEVFTNAVQFSSSDNGWAYRVTVNHTDPQQVYTQWQLEWAVTTGGGCDHCTVNSSYLIQGFESFGSTGTRFVSPTATNAAFSFNAAGNWTIENGTITASSLSQAPAWSKSNPMVSISTNTGPTALGGTISNISITVNYINADNDIPVGIIGSADNPSTIITGGSYVAPNYAAPSTLEGPQGIRTQGTGTAVSNFTSCGTLKAGSPSFSRANIGLQFGSVTNSTATVIVAPTISGNVACP